MSVLLVGAAPGSSQDGQKQSVHQRIGKEFDLQGSINEQIQAGRKRIVVPPGRYRVTPKDRQHLVLEGLSDTEITADGVEMICTATTRAMSISDCRNVRIRGFTIDHDPLPFAQGRIVDMAPDKSWLEFETIDGYRKNPEMRIEIFDGATDMLKTDTRFDCQPFEALGNRRYRVAKGEGYRLDPQTDQEEVGDILAPVMAAGD